MNATLYLVTILCWGTSWLVTKLHLGVVAPEVSLVYRFVIAAVLTYAICIALKKPMRFPLAQHRFMALQGLFLFSTNFLLIYLGTQYLTSGLVAIVFSLVVVFNIFGQTILFRTPLESRVLLGAALGLSGLSVVFWPEIAAFDLAKEGTRGLLLCLAGTVSASCGMLTSAWNQSRRALPVFQTNAYGMSYGAALTLLYCLANGSRFNFDPSPIYIGSLLHLSLLASVTAFWTYLTLVGRIGAGRAGYVTAVFPLVALALSTLVEGYTWSLAAGVGVALILLGNVAILSRPKPAAPAKV
jgi:drug/metabolite transporter (DMT)-like permease